MGSILRVGLMGGSFDPIHLGHVQIAFEAWNSMKLDKVFFLPSGHPPHKTSLGASPTQRLEMTKLALHGLSWAEISDVEVFREGTVYTVDTLTILKSEQPDTEFYFIIGADTLLDLPNWCNPARVCSLCSFVCVQRPGIRSQDVDETLGNLKAQYQAKVNLIRASGPEISSTEIRRRISEGKNTEGLLDARVRAYIDREKLYRS